ALPALPLMPDVPHSRLLLDGAHCERLPGDEVGGQAVLGRQSRRPTPWLTERHGYDPSWRCRRCR
ncbi:hypothetical protein, partial [Pseudomonas aeruginosa]|uniref:hypothetical protein n=1 Tax=Pseudomonas aeruginosa TaxID=287 RepID=UPI003D160C1C